MSIFKCTIPMALSSFRNLYNHHHYPFLKLFHQLKYKLHIHWTIHCPLSIAPGDHYSTLCLYSGNLMKLHNVCPFVSDLFHLSTWLQGSSILKMYKNFTPFLRVNHIPLLCICYIILIHSFTDRHVAFRIFTKLCNLYHPKS